MTAIQSFIEEITALQEKVQLLEAEIAVLRAMDARSTFGNKTIPQEVRVFGRSIAELANDLDRLRRFDIAASTHKVAA